MSKFLLAVLAVIAVLVVLGVSSYNGLVGKQQGVDAAWAQVSNQYQRRADLVPNLVKTVQGSADFEKSTLESVTNARASVGRMTIDASKAPETAAQLEEYQKAQGAFGSALQRLLVVAERYPDLKASAGFRDLQAQLEGTENRIAVERGRFNDAAKDYNTSIRKIPAVFYAGMLGFNPKPFFQAAARAEKAPEVNFDFGGKSGGGQ
jgi:LemA protein